MVHLVWQERKKEEKLNIQRMIDAKRQHLATVEQTVRDNVTLVVKSAAAFARQLMEGPFKVRRDRLELV
jgi:hypothetical protein